MIGRNEEGVCFPDHVCLDLLEGSFARLLCMLRTAQDWLGSLLGLDAQLPCLRSSFPPAESRDMRIHHDRQSNLPPSVSGPEELEDHAAVCLEMQM